MTPAVYDMTIVDFDLGRYLFRATGSVLVFDGYHTLYLEGREKEEGKTMDDLPPIPPLAKGDTVEVREITPSQHFTEPPPRFSEASLVKELERLGIGRPSTYASIISVLVDRRYVNLEQRRFSPTSSTSRSPPRWKGSWTRSRRRGRSGRTSCATSTVRSRARSRRWT
jgi:DNA topoisomerase-1